MTRTITEIVRYPVKGLQGESLESAAIEPGKPIPGDRAFALATQASRFNPQAPEWRPKGDFLNLVRHERLARLAARLDGESGRLALLRDGRQVVEGDPADPTGRAILEQFLGAFLDRDAQGPVRLARGADISFSDAPMPLISIVNLASLRDAERVAYGELDRRRFRANLYYDGGRAWEEMEWIGKEIAIGDANVKVVEPIERCGATNVNPVSAERDMNVLLALESGFNHLNMGIYASVSAAGRLAAGDALTPPS